MAASKNSPKPGDTLEMLLRKSLAPSDQILAGIDPAPETPLVGRNYSTVVDLSPYKAVMIAVNVLDANAIVEVKAGSTWVEWIQLSSSAQAATISGAFTLTRVSWPSVTGITQVLFVGKV